MTSNAIYGAAAGAVGGLAGAWMMTQFQTLLGGQDSGSKGAEPESGTPEQQERKQRGSPNDTDGTISDEPATMKAASALSEMVTGRPLGKDGKELGGPLVHYAFGALMGALYGAAAEVQPEATAGFGAPFGAAVWVTADEIGVPLAGFSAKPTEYPLSTHASALGSHLVYGVTVEAVRRLIRGNPAERDEPVESRANHPAAREHYAAGYEG